MKNNTNTIILLLLLTVTGFATNRSNFNPNKSAATRTDSCTVDYSFLVFNLDVKDIYSLHRNDSIYQQFGIKETAVRQNIYRLSKNDSTYYLFFKSLKTCCPLPLAKASCEQNIIFLDYTPSSEEPVCKTACEYMFIYGFAAKDLKNNVITTE
jgi:hypothetical protein